jgi:hypothetical protein
MTIDDYLDHPDLFWDDLLSREPEKVLSAFVELTKTDQKVVLEHLQEMVEGEGWQPTQRESAAAALQAIIKHLG